MIDRMLDHLNKGEYQTVKRLASAMLVSADVSPHERGQAALIGAQAAMMTREPFLASSLAQRALSLAQEAGDSDLEGRALFQIAAARLAIGDNSDARIYLREFFAGLADHWPHLDEELSARAYGNLGMALRNQRLYPDSLQAFWQALIRVQRQGDVRGQVMCHHQMAWVLMLIGDLDAAAEHLMRANDLGDLGPDLSTHQLTHEAFLLLYQGDYAGATAKAEQALLPERPAVSATSRAVACYVVADAARRLGQHDVARRFALLAREAALEDGLSSVLNMVSELLRTVKLSSPELGQP